VMWAFGFGAEGLRVKGGCLPTDDPCVPAFADEQVPRL
jgi:hypothetical protein